jgi:NTP pyrophosphatase (non-canonical NTP hydrolase)
MKAHTDKQLLGLLGEIGEFSDAIKILPWKSGQTDIDYDHVKEELIDVYHFFMNLCAIWGIKDEAELKRIYYKKNLLNYERGKIHQKPTEGFKVNDD